MGFVHVRVRGHFGHLGVTPFNMSCKFLSMIMKLLLLLLLLLYIILEYLKCLLSAS
jgi:hypothetical protein